MYTIYNLILLLIIPILSPFLLFKFFTDKRYRIGLGERFGILPKVIIEGEKNQNSIWIHCASVGEVLAARPFIATLTQKFPNRPVLFSTMTAAGQEMARDKLSNIKTTFYFPLDLPWAVRRAFNKLKPTAVIILETEFWPNFLREAQKRKIPVLVINGRISPASFKRYRWIKPFLKKVLSMVELFAMQSEPDRERITILGADPAKVLTTGNLKFDVLPSTDKATTLPDGLVSFLSHSELFIAGSTYPGEEEVVLEIFQEFSGQRPGMKLLIAPRQLKRTEEIERLIKKRNLKMVRRSETDNGFDPEISVILLDTMGELGDLYRWGRFIFVGGSLVPRGGHNILEPALMGKVVFFGPHMDNFLEAKQILLKSGAGIMVHSAEEFKEKLQEALADPEWFSRIGEKARETVREQGGATERNLKVLERYLSG
ncbi:MAG: 3-deoxy-D-manno-octulosonic acid transferase [Deltaproteobacteria bacterium]|nr:MAG: 3-deoxy-D-manno-octulosonic acid transferase [Deltaproteobacteria bacterium]